MSVSLKHRADIFFPVANWKPEAVDPAKVEPGDDPAKHMPLHELVKMQVNLETSKIVAAVQIACEQLGFADADIASTIFDIRLVVDEALSNSLKHGHQTDPNKKLTLSWTVEDKALMLHVQDEGPGFDVQKKLEYDATADENLGKAMGRGILLIRCYMDQVLYNDKGNAVMLRKNLDRSAKKEESA